MIDLARPLAAPLLLCAGLAGGCGFYVDPLPEQHWGYEDGLETVGPEHWGVLDGNELCAGGQRQTPIALQTTGPEAAVPADLPDLGLSYRPSTLHLANNGHTVQAVYDAGSTMAMEGTPLRLAQLHFHAPSEHTLEGERYPMEMHLVHVDAEGKPAAVVGVLIREGAQSDALAAAFAALPRTKDATSAPEGQTIDAGRLLPGGKVYVAYDGSLTTPPCTEGIRWRVLTEPIEMSMAQIEAFTSIPGLRPTNRPLQPLNGRVPRIDATP